MLGSEGLLSLRLLSVLGLCLPGPVLGLSDFLPLEACGSVLALCLGSLLLLLGALAIIGVKPGDQLRGWLWAPSAECPSDRSLSVGLSPAWLAPGLVSIAAPRGLGRPGWVWG